MKLATFENKPWLCKASASTIRGHSSTVGKPQQIFDDLPAAGVAWMERS
jgi:hypothetical protein